jgi:UDP-N-acetylmuramoyl-L-alanyl-D-glutamate--2,6-diaminopimelate ligase
MAIESKRSEVPARRVALADLVGHHGLVEIRGDAATLISGISYDSRVTGPGDLFVALRGGYFDGHAFIRAAIENGAVAVLVEDDQEFQIPRLVAHDTRAALAPVAAAFYGHPADEMTVIGVTGTDGKTTTTYLIDDILRAAGRVTGTVGTVSVRIGGEVVEHETRQTTPESLDVQRYLRKMVDAGVDTAILEATSHGLDLHRLDEVRFGIAAVTNITHEHLEHHKTTEGYRRAKAILFERVAESEGVAVINLDDPGSKGMLLYTHGATLLTYSTRDAKADIFASSISTGMDGSSFTLTVNGAHFDCKIPLVGTFNVENALCAIGVALACDVDLKTAVPALAQASTVPGRLARVEGGQPFTVIVDYAHTPESLTKVLRLLRELNPGGKLIAVSGSAGERDLEKRPLQGAASHRFADISVFTTEDPRFEDAEKIISDIAAGAHSAGGVEGETYFCLTDRRDAIWFAFSVAKAGDAVLLAGKGHERSIIWGPDKRPWNEAAVASELLDELGYRERR